MQHAWPWDISIAPTRYEVSQTSKQTMYLDVRLFLCSQQQLTHSSKKKARSSGLVPTPFAHGQPFLPSSPADYMWGAFIVGTPHVIWHYLAEIADVYARSRVFTQVHHRVYNMCCTRSPSTSQREPRQYKPEGKRKHRTYMLLLDRARGGCYGVLDLSCQ